MKKTYIHFAQTSMTVMVILVTQVLFLQLKFKVTQVDKKAIMLKDWELLILSRVGTKLRYCGMFD